MDKKEKINKEKIKENIKKELSQKKDIENSMVKDKNQNFLISFINFFSKYTEKGIEYSKILTIKSDIFFEERKINKLFMNLGEIFYKSLTNPDILKTNEEEINIIKAEIDKRYLEIDKLKNKIELIKKKSKISDSEIDDLMNFIPNKNEKDDFEEEFINIDYIKKNKNLNKLLKKIKKK